MARGPGSENDGKWNRKFSSVLNSVSSLECKDTGYYEIANDQICAGSDQQYPCIAEVGGPIMETYKHSHSYTIFGIRSQSYCADNSPGIFTKVANYVDWIRKNIDDNSNTISRNGI